MVAVQIFNTDYWDFLFHAVVAANGPASFLFFVLAVLFLNFYLANLVQAVVALSYQVDEDEDDEDEPESIQQARKTATTRRFVFDATRLRLILVGPDARTRSMQSVKNVTERKLSIVKPSSPSHKVAPTNSNAAVNDTNQTAKPVAVVKPQLSQQLSEASAERRRTMSSSYSTHHPHHLQTEQEGRLRAASRPPSAVANEDLPKIGYWDRNPLCCFKCLPGFFGWLRFQHYMYLFVTDPFFELFITISIAINTISMAAYHYQIPPEVDQVLNRINDVCTYIFIAEAVFKLTAMCGEYFENRWNWLDLIVVIGSLVDIATSNISSGGTGFNTSIIRLLRLLRILKLAQSWKTMRMVILFYNFILKFISFFLKCLTAVGNYFRNLCCHSQFIGRFGDCHVCFRRHWNANLRRYLHDRKVSRFPWSTDFHSFSRFSWGPRVEFR